MNTVDKISRDTKLVVDSIGDVISQKLLSARETGSLNLSDDQISSVIKLVNLSIGEGYQRAVPSFQKSISSYLK